MPAFAENLIVDLHDLATILMREHLYTDPRFRHSRLREINDGSKLKDSLCINVHNVGYTFLSEGDDEDEDEVDEENEVNIVHILFNDSNLRADEVVDLADFKHPELESTSELSDRDIETIYWGVKNSNRSCLMAYALQGIICQLPMSTKLRLRTSGGFESFCPLKGFKIIQLDIFAHKTRLLSPVTFLPDLGPTKASSSMIVVGRGRTPWLYAVFEDENSGLPSEDVPDRSEDRRVMLDLCTTMLGERGLGDEVFAMEQVKDYHSQILPRCCDEAGPRKQTDMIIFDKATLGEKAEVVVLIRRTLERLEKILRGDETFCAYCGKREAPLRCSRCKGTKYCDTTCQAKGWKYHKTWCKRDASAAS